MDASSSYSFVIATDSIGVADDGSFEISTSVSISDTKTKSPATWRETSLSHLDISVCVTGRQMCKHRKDLTANGCEHRNKFQFQKVQSCEVTRHSYDLDRNGSQEVTVAGVWGFLSLSNQEAGPIWNSLIVNAQQRLARGGVGAWAKTVGTSSSTRSLERKREATGHSKL